MPHRKAPPASERIYLFSRRHPWACLAAAACLALLTAVALMAGLGWADEQDRAETLSVEARRRAVEVLVQTLNGKTMGALAFLGISNLAPKQVVLGDLPADTPFVLEALHFLGRYYQADSCFLIDENGIVQSSWNSDGRSSTGLNIAFRPYFRMGLQGRENIHAAVSLNGGQRALYLAAPIFERNTADSRVVGVAAMRQGLGAVDALLRSWGRPAALVTPNGVVFAATDPDWIFRIIGRPSDDAVRALRESRQFGGVFDQKAPLPMPFDPALPRAEIGGRSHILAEASLDLNDPQGLWSILLLDDVHDLYWSPARLWLGSVAGAGCLFLLFAGQAFLRGAHVRREAQAAIRQSQAEMTQIFNTAASGMRVIGRDSTMLKVNDAFVALSGYSREELVGARCSELFGGMECDTGECSLARILQGEARIESTGMRSGNDGMPVYCDMACTPLLSPDGEIVGVIEDFRDMTERMKTQHLVRQSEEKYRELVESASSIILKLDMQGRITFFNEYAQSFFGFTEDEILGQSVVGTIVPPLDSRSRDLASMIEDILQAPATFEKNENENQRKDGSRAWISWTNKAILDEIFGTPKGLLCIGIDATERKKAQDKLHDALEIISGSIRYASRIQRAILPAPEQVAALVPNHFVLWEPRDVVGGDIYWVRPWGEGTLLILADCTGHGVPGAFITLIASGALDRAVAEIEPGDPAALISRMNVYVKLVLSQDLDYGQDEGSDDGLEPGVCYIPPSRDRVVFAGGHFQLFSLKDGQVDVVKGDRHGIGYRRIPVDARFTNHTVEASPGQRFFLATDGIIDQVGGSPRRSFGKKRLSQLLVSLSGAPLHEHGPLLLEAVSAFQGAEKRRDDISVIGFEL